VYADVKSGLLLSDALNKHKKVFPHFFRSMVRVGELSGNMETVFSSLADYYESDRAIKAKVKSALSYPMMLLGMTVGIVILMMLVVVPTFRETMAQMEVEITGITKVVYDLSDFVLAYWKVMLAGIVTVGLIVFLVGRTDKGAFFFDKMKMHIPLVKTIQRNLHTARFARAFGLLLSSGMDLNNAMDAIEVIMGNRYMKKKFHDAAESVRQGMSLTLAFETYKLFPQMMINIKIGKENTISYHFIFGTTCISSVPLIDIVTPDTKLPLTKILNSPSSICFTNDFLPVFSIGVPPTCTCAFPVQKLSS
jgi:type IV pilus assembly protein PilC